MANIVLFKKCIVDILEICFVMNGNDQVYFNTSSWTLPRIFEGRATHNQLQKYLPRSLQMIWNYQQPLKITPNQSMLRVRLGKLMQYWCNIVSKWGGGVGWGCGGRGAWWATKLISAWVRVWQRYFVTGCLKILEMYCIFFFGDDTLNLLKLQQLCTVKSGLFHKTIFLNWLTLFKRKLK